MSSYQKANRTPFGSTMYQYKNQTYSNYLNEQTSVLAQKREGDKKLHDRSLLSGTDALRQKSISATSKFITNFCERTSRNQAAQGK